MKMFPINYILVRQFDWFVKGFSTSKYHVIKIWVILLTSKCGNKQTLVYYVLLLFANTKVVNDDRTKISQYHQDNILVNWKDEDIHKF